MEFLIVSLLSSALVPLAQDFAKTLWAWLRRRSLRLRIGMLEIELGTTKPEQLSALLGALGSEDLRLLEYTVQRDEAERELASYLPDNPRRAKRLLNHERLYARIAEDRNIFGGTPELTHRHLAKWILIMERWPRLGATLTRDPSQMRVLEEASDSAALQKEVSFAGVRATDRLFEVIHEGVLLSPILERLVRFEASASYSESGNADTPTCQTANGNVESQTPRQAEVTS